MRGPAGALLAARAQLGLSDEQVKRLEALAAQQATALAPAAGDRLRARADLMDAMKGEGDAAALKRAMDKAHQLRTERALAMLKARQDARAILTADQRSRADALRGPRRGGPGRGMRRGGGARGMRPGMGPMMRPDARPPRPGDSQP
jgi:Spy/CpxP family protein refolding chaperone